MSSLATPGEQRPAALRGRRFQVRGREAARPALPTAESVQHAVHVVLPAQALKEGDEVQQLCVRHVIEPGLHGHLEDSVCRGAAERTRRWGQLLA